MDTEGSIEVGHEEGDILCTIVLLKCLAERGGGHSIALPLSVRLGGEAGWRRAAIQFLDVAKARRQMQQKYFPEKAEPRDAGRYQELNERFDFEEACERSG